MAAHRWGAFAGDVAAVKARLVACLAVLTFGCDSDPATCDELADDLVNAAMDQRTDMIAAIEADMVEAGC